MPLLLPKSHGITHEMSWSGRPGGTTWGTALPSHATVAHTEPTTPTQLIASTSFDSDWVVVRFHNNLNGATNTDSLVNIKVGAASSEVTIIPNLMAGWVSDTNAFCQYTFPLRIPAGSRISATHRSVRTGVNVYCFVELFGGNQSMHWTGTGVEAVGADTATSSGTAVTPGSTNEGTLTSIGTNTYEWGYVFPMTMGNTDTTMTAEITGFDIATGSTTGDVIPGLENFWSGSNTGEFQGHFPDGRYCRIPASTTLYLRAQYGGVAEARDYIIYGVY